MTEKYGILASEKIANVGDTLQLEGRSPDGSSDPVYIWQYQPYEYVDG